MTEREWLNGRRPGPMLDCFGDSLSDRQVRLFGLAACAARLADDGGEDEHPFLRRAERIVDKGRELRGGNLLRYSEPGFMGPADVADAMHLLLTGRLRCRRLHNESEPRTWLERIEIVSRLLIDQHRYLWTKSVRADRNHEMRRQADLLREIVGNPFQPIDFDPQWRTNTVTEVGRTIYENKHFDQLPILADALVDAGCDSTSVIEHLHSPGPHVKGCWALDLALGKNWIA